MKTIVVLMCLIALGGCKKEETTTDESTNTLEVKFTGKWTKFQCRIVYDSDGIGNADSSRKVNEGETSQTSPYYPLFKNQGYALPYTVSTKGHIEAYILEESKHNMTDSDWVYIELYENGKLFSHTDTITAKNLGLLPWGKDRVKK